MQNLKRALARYYKSVLHYFETGDLVLFLVVISVFHFVGALSKYDPAPVALAVGIAVDVGVYRLVKASLKFGGWWWLAAVALGVVSYGYHVEYYAASSNAWLLALPLPALIVLLAALSHRERYAEKLAKDLALPASAVNANSTPTAKPAPASVPNDVPNVPPAPRGTYEQFKLANLARNGSGPMNAPQIMAQFNVPKRTAYNWMQKYDAETRAEKVSVN